MFLNIYHQQSIKYSNNFLKLFLYVLGERMWGLVKILVFIVILLISLIKAVLKTRGNNLIDLLEFDFYFISSVYQQVGLQVIGRKV